MNIASPHAGISAPPAAPFAPATFSTTLTPARRAALVLAGAGAFGVVTQALFRGSALGLNFLLWTVVSAAACLVSVTPPRVTPVARAAMGAAVLLALAVVRFAGDWTFAIAVPATLGLLAVLPIALRDEVGFTSAARLPRAALRSVAPSRAARAIRDALRLPGVALGGEHETLKQVLGGLAVGVPITIVFTLLLAADVDFSRFLLRAERRVSDGLSFGGWSLVTASGALVAHALYGRPRGEGMEAPSPVAYRHFAVDPELAPKALPGRVAVSTWTMVVGQVALVFGLFVAVNLQNLFGGHAIVRAPGSLTYARYLHAGFGQLLVASALSVWLVVLGHRLLVPRGAAERAPIPGGRVLVATECALLAFTAVTVASCAQRLAIYEDAYGATRLRLGVAFIVVAVLGALALTGFKAVRRGWDGYGGALAVGLVGLTVVAAWFNADAYVARVNLDRAERGKPLDVSYLASLSTDAASVLSHPAVTRGAGLEARLRGAYCERASAGWRAFRGMGSLPACPVVQAMPAQPLDTDPATAPSRESL